MRGLFFPAVIFLLFTSSLVGCSSNRLMAQKIVVATVPEKKISEMSIKEHLKISISTQMDIETNFGKTKKIRFKNGYEIWGYSFASEKNKMANNKPGSGELVLLFNPNAVLSKVRVSINNVPVVLDKLSSEMTIGLR